MQVNNLESRYGDFQALHGVSLEVAPSEVIAIIGANGAGKSTLLRSITGLILNQEEQIVFADKKIGNLRPDLVAKIGIAMVPEGRQLFRSLSVEENLLIGSTTSRTNGHWSLERVYEFFPILKERRNHQSTKLSGGQQQMVAIGRALMSNPDLILMDEVSLGLAPIVINEIYEAIPKIIAEGMSAVIVEQDIARALSVSKRFYCLQEGHITLAGDSANADRAAISDAYFGIEKSTANTSH